MSDNEFWQFSCRFYRLGQQDFLDLQNEADLNINMLLFCCWLGVKRVRLGVAHLRAARAIADAYECDFVAPLRAVRMRAQHLEDKSLYQNIKSLELAFEKCVQADLFDYAAGEKSLQLSPPHPPRPPHPPSPSSSARLSEANLHAYLCEVSAVPAPHWIYQNLKTIVAHLSTLNLSALPCHQSA